MSSDIPSNGNNTRQTVREIYRYIQDNLYLNRPDMEIAGSSFNSATLMSLLTGLCQGNELIIGEPGLGKTTSAEYICVLLYRFPLGVIWTSEVSGHPEQTEEKIIGRPDLGKLNIGEEYVIWSNFVLLPVKIIDEVNRLPETKQSIILDGVDRGKWEYLNDLVINEESCLFATTNYQDRGTNTIIAPLIDRFDIVVESKHPGANFAFAIGQRTSAESLLRSPELETEFLGILGEITPYDVRLQKLEGLCDRFGDYLWTRKGIKSLSHSQREEIRRESFAIPFDLDANAFLRLVISELSFCNHSGQKRSNDNCLEGCHFSSYLCNRVVGCISNRFPSSVRKYSQALAWFLDSDRVAVEHVQAVLPYTLAHRLQWKEEAIAKLQKRVRNDPLNIYMAKEAVREMHQRYAEQSSHVKDALAVACRILEGERLEPVKGDHPLYWDIYNDLRKGEGR